MADVAAWHERGVALDEIARRFDGQPEPTADDVSRTSDGRELRTAEQVMAFVAELQSEGLLAG